MFVRRTSLLLAIGLVGALATPAAAVIVNGNVPVSGDLPADSDASLLDVTPDSRHVIISGDLLGDGSESVWVTPVTGDTSPVRLHETPVAPPNPKVLGRAGTRVILDLLLLAPDSTRAVFVADLDGDGGPELRSAPIPATGSSTLLVEYDAVACGGGPARACQSPFISLSRGGITPDSQAVIFRGNPGDESDDPGSGMYHVPLDGSTAPTLLHTPGLTQADNVNITASGDFVTFNVNNGGIGELWAASLDTLDGWRVSQDGVTATTGNTHVQAGDRVLWIAQPAASARHLYSRALTPAAPTLQLSSDTSESGVSVLNGVTGGRAVYLGTFDASGNAKIYSAPVAAEGGQGQVHPEFAEGSAFSSQVVGERVLILADINESNKRELLSAPADGVGGSVVLNEGLAVDRVVSFFAGARGDVVLFDAVVTATGEEQRFLARTDGAGDPVQVDLVDGEQLGDATFVQYSDDGRYAVFRATTADEVTQLLSTDVVTATTVVLADLSSSPNVFEFAFLSPANDRVAILTQVLPEQDRRATATIGVRSVPFAGGAPTTINDPYPAGATGPSRANDFPGGGLLAMFAPDGSFVAHSGDMRTAEQIEIYASSRGLPASAPGAVSAGERTDTSLTVSWVASPGPDLTGYEVEATPVGRRAARAATATVGPDTTTATLTDLAPDTAYDVTVTAVNAVGRSGAATLRVSTLATVDEPDPPSTPDGLVRIDGADRFDTAARTAVASFSPDEVSTVYLATGRGFPDALAGGPLAAAQGAPILLTERDSLPEPTRTALETLGPDRVVVLGGEVVVSTAVEAAAGVAAGGATTSRLAGPDRFATAAAIAAELPAGFDTVYLATGRNFPDALAGGPATDGAPILLTEPGALPAATEAALADLAPATVVALGGSVAVADEVLVAAGAAAGGGTDRIAGLDRFLTAAAVAGLVPAPDTVYVATGRNFPDALAAGPAAELEGAPIVLTEQGELPAATLTFLATLDLRRIVVLGGEVAVSPAVSDALQALLDG